MAYNKYGNRHTWNETCQRTFDSHAESKRATELFLAEKCGEVSELEYQVPVILSKNPRVKIIVDFKYIEKGQVVYEEVKGMMTPAARVKLAWLKDKYKIDVKITK